MTAGTWQSGPDRTTFPTSWIRGISTVLPKAEATVLIYFMTWAGPGNTQTWVGMQRIALETGLGLRSVERGVAGLRAAGLITRTRRLGRTALTTLNMDAISALDVGGSGVTSLSHDGSVTADPPEVADLNPPEVADLNPPDLAGKKEQGREGTDREDGHGPPSAPFRRPPGWSEESMKTEEDGSVLDSEGVSPRRRPRKPRGPRGAHLLAATIREEMAVQWPGRAFPNADMKELGIWAKFRDAVGEEVAVTTVRWAVRNWGSLVRRFRIEGFPSAAVIMGFRDSLVPEATAPEEAAPKTEDETPDRGWRTR